MIPITRAIIAILIIGVASIFLIPAQWLAMRFNWDMKRSLPQLWHRLVANMIGVKIIVNGSPDTGKPLLVAANHTSWLDVPVIGSLAPFAFVAQKGIGAWPALRLLASLQGALIPGAESGKPARMQGPLLVFAEGKANAGNGILPFQADLIEAARAALADGAGEIWVQPLSVAYTTLQGLPMGRQFRPVIAWTGTIRFLPHFWIVMREYSIDAVVSFGDPIRCGENDDIAEIVRHAEDSVRKMTANVLTGRSAY